jgi:SAM-dependent methyltransferase
MKTKNKIILDVACGGKMFWFDKNNPYVLFVDKRKENFTLCDGRKFAVNPDKIMDFRRLELPDGAFKMVVFDPPHLKQLGKTSWMAKKYDVLSDSWEKDIQAGFKECFRVLGDYGVLIFKWNEEQVKLKQVLSLAPTLPLIGHTSGRNGNTQWMCFMKIPK